MPNQPNVRRLELIETPPTDGDALGFEELETMELVIAAVLGGDGTQMARIFRVCCYNSRRKPSQLTPEWIMALPGLGGTSHSEFSRLRKKVNDFASSPDGHQQPFVIRFQDSPPRYAVLFTRNYTRARTQREDLQDSPVRTDRFVTLDHLLNLERGVPDGGHLVKHGTLIIQGDAPFILKPAVAEIAVDNMSKGICYQFVFPHDQPEDLAALLASLLKAGEPRHGIKHNSELIGDRLELGLTQHAWPFVISVHNAGDETAAKSYIVVEETKPEVLFQLASGVRAQQIAKKIRALVIEDPDLPDSERWLHSPVDERFRRSLMKTLTKRLHLASDQQLIAELEVRIFGEATVGASRKAAHSF